MAREKEEAEKRAREKALREIQERIQAEELRKQREIENKIRTQKWAKSISKEVVAETAHIPNEGYHQSTPDC